MKTRAFTAALAACVVVSFSAGLRAAETPPATKASAERPRQDAAGNPIRYAPSGHVSNYDEAKVGKYTLPDPLVLQNGKPVRDAETWRTQRRPELVKLYENEIYGQKPERLPAVRFEVAETEAGALDGAATRKRIVGQIGDSPDAPKVNVTLWLPARATEPVPVLLHLQFFGGATPPSATAGATAGVAPANTAPATTPATSAAPGAAPAAARARPSENGPIAEMLARGYGYATVRYTEFEGDRVDSSLTGVRKLALAPGQEKPAANEWGTIAAWSWGASRVLDFLATEKAVDARRVALIGHSRLGKTVLWAGASDERFALIFSSCSGEMGAALARRDWGESVDDMATNFSWQFAGNFQKYVGKWNDMPVDAHCLIALQAPRPVFVTGGTTDQWADPKGQFLAQVAAGPVYRLLGKSDLGTTELPALDQPLTKGTLGFLYHTGGHTIMPGDWQAFFAFAEGHLQPKRFAAP